MCVLTPELNRRLPGQVSSSASFALISEHTVGLTHTGLKEHLESGFLKRTPAQGRESGTAGPGQLQGQLGEVSGGGILDACR